MNHADLASRSRLRSPWLGCPQPPSHLPFTTIDVPGATFTEALGINPRGPLSAPTVMETPARIPPPPGPPHHHRCAWRHGHRSLRY